MRYKSGLIEMTLDGGTVKVTNDGRTVYLGDVEELADVLERHSEFMDHIDSLDGDGNERVD